MCVSLCMEAPVLASEQQMPVELCMKTKGHIYTFNGNIIAFEGLFTLFKLGKIQKHLDSALLYTLHMWFVLQQEIIKIQFLQGA